jgi:ubiquinone/menaquinone biosynthesis C-methylase UbiE
MSEGASRVKSNLEWQAWGEKDPLFGVIPAAGRGRSDSSPWTDEDFYATGRIDWEELVERWRKYGLDESSCLEIGCGAGRLTQSIANNFATVYGVDVSEGMIAYARQHVGENTRLFVTDGVTLPLPDQSITSAFSFIVFLHFDSAQHTMAYFREIGRVLKPGGTMMIQLPLHSWPINVKPIVRYWFSSIHQGYMALRRAKAAYHRFWLARDNWSPFMQSNSYEEHWLRSTLDAIGFAEIETCSFRMVRASSVYSWLFARKV